MMRFRLSKRAWIGAWLICLCLTATAAHAQLSVKAPSAGATTSDADDEGTVATSECPDGKLRMDFVDADIRDVIKTVSKMTDSNFLIDAKVTGKITLISPACVTKKEAYEIFLAVLEVNGFTVFRQGAIYKIVQKSEAGRTAIPTRDLGDWVSPTSDQFITQLIPLTNISAETVQSMFADFISADGRMIAYSPSNTLIVVDSEAVISRLIKIIERLDVEGIDETIEVIALQHADATTIADQIQMLFPELAEPTGTTSRATRTTSRVNTRGKTTRAARTARPGTTTDDGLADREQVTSIIPDLRTNSLIVRANRLGIRRIRNLVTKLDVPIPGGEGKIHVYYLQNAIAEEVAAVLQGLTGNAQSGTSNVSRSQQGQAASRLAQSFGASAGAAGALGNLGTGGLSGVPVAEFEGGVRITADQNTNSLVIVASQRDYEVLKQVIEKLDIKRRQVFVQAIILEISLDKSRQLGFEFRSANDASDGGTQVIGGSNFGGISNAAQNPLGIAGLAIGAADGTISFGGTEYPNIFALFTALQTDSDVNVLSTPTLLTTDAEEAEIIVADNIPFVTGQLFSQANNNPVTTVERQDVGITLRLTPQINESNRVTLNIEQEVSNVAESPEGLSASNVGVTTSKRSAKTVVVVDDRQTVVIGGLMKDDVGIAESKVPLLGDIPILGYLFKQSKKTNKKTNLIIFLTPYIIRDEMDMETITRMQDNQFKRFKEENQVVERKNEDRYPDVNSFTAPETADTVGPNDVTIQQPEYPSSIDRGDDETNPDVDDATDDGAGDLIWDDDDDAGDETGEEDDADVPYVIEEE